VDLAETLEEYEFQAGVNCLMDKPINSPRTDEQVFLWKLVSNVADALERARFHSVSCELRVSRPRAGCKEQTAELSAEPERPKYELAGAGMQQ